MRSLPRKDVRRTQQAKQDDFPDVGKMGLLVLYPAGLARQEILRGGGSNSRLPHLERNLRLFAISSACLSQKCAASRNCADGPRLR